MMKRIAWITAGLFAAGMLAGTAIGGLADAGNVSLAPSASAEHVCLQAADGCACVHLYCLLDGGAETAAAGDAEDASHDVDLAAEHVCEYPEPLQTACECLHPLECLDPVVTVEIVER